MQLNITTLLRLLLLLIMPLAAMEGCTHDPLTAREVTIVREPRPCDADSVYFENDIQPLLGLFCATSGCHDEATAEEGVVLTTYDRVMSTGDVRAGQPENSELYDVLLKTDPQERMPPSPRAALSADQIEMVRKWIAQGALNNRCDEEPVVDTICAPDAPSYANDVLPILQSNACVSCHSGGGTLLNSYSAVKGNADNGKLIGALKHLSGFRPMPDGAPNPIDSCSIATIELWINQGANDN
jgi:hypothetical protein